MGYVLAAVGALAAGFYWLVARGAERGSLTKLRIAFVGALAFGGVIGFLYAFSSRHVGLFYPYGTRGEQHWMGTYTNESDCVGANLALSDYVTRTWEDGFYASPERRQPPRPAPVWVCLSDCSTSVPGSPSDCNQAYWGGEGH